MNDSADATGVSAPEEQSGTAAAHAFKNLSVVSRDAIGFTRGAWEMLQNPKLLELYARHYGWEILEHHGMLLTVRRFPVVGILRASAHSPEANCGGDWYELLAKLPAGHISVMTNLPDRQSQPIAGPQNDIYSFIVDLSLGSETLFKRFEKRTRQAVRNGSRSGLHVRLAETQQDFNEFHAIADRASDHGKRYHVPPCNLLEALSAAGFGRLYVAMFKGRLVGGMYLLVDRYAHGLVSAYDVQATEGVPGNLLYWELILKEMDRGTPFLDFGAQSLSEHPQLTFFKRGFSPMLVPVYRYDLHPSRWRSVGYHAWELSKRVRAKR